MMKEGGDWWGFDQHFGKLMECQPVSWATANLNLIWHYNNKKRAQPLRQQSRQYTVSPYQKPNIISCRSYNNPHFQNCSYPHVCSSCGSFTDRDNIDCLTIYRSLMTVRL